VVEQKSWADIFMEQLAIPLRMTNTDYYGYVGGEIITDNPNVAGSIRTNIDDYMRFLYMIYNNGIFNGEEILSQNAVQAVTTSYSESLSVVRNPFEPYYSVAPEMMLLETGLGNWLLEDENNKPRYAVSGGAWGCMPFIDYERNLVGIYLPNSTDAEIDPDTKLYTNPATTVFFRDLKPILDQVFAN
jgi:CubicO group peptidase (beta-lactamase class C family)